jgi:putative acyl-CoA dehydrogenase
MSTVLDDPVFAARPLNQPPPLVSVDLYATDRALRDAVARHGASWATDDLHALGRRITTPELIEAAALANRHGPELQTHDRYGNRRDEVLFHPAYHALMRLGCEAGLHSSPWASPRPGAQAARAAGYLLYGQLENGTQCPMTMTFAGTPLLSQHASALPMLAADWLPRLHARAYDGRLAPIGDKQGALLGMGMTEKQGGSDVRANVSVAAPAGDRGPGQRYRLRGHKWFMSAPMCDAFLVLAQAPGGLSCFFVPRFVDDRLNALRLQRLKDKLGNRSNASSEVEFHDADGFMLGDEGRGVPTILEMVNFTRLDCALGSSALMRQAFVQAAHHAAHRHAFGRRLAEHALMRNVLADLALEAEAATALSMWLAALFDREDEAAAALRRLMTPAAKFWLCKRAAAYTQEAMEVLGGNGYVEESIMPRLYREAPVNSIWEGSGNVMCLDVLRALRREPATGEALLALLLDARGADRRLDAATRALQDGLQTGGEESQARRLTSQLVLAVQALLLLRHAPAAVADAFCASRLAGDPPGVFGMLPAVADCATIVSRAWPHG